MPGLFLIAVCLLFPVHGRASAESAFAWLAESQGADGTYGLDTDIASAYQATSEVLQAAKPDHKNPDADYSKAIEFIRNSAGHSTEYLSRKIISLAAVDSGLSSWLDDLMMSASANGGFGEYAGFQTTVLDTAFALQAMNAAGSNGSSKALNALAYLLSRQNSSGAWSNGDDLSNVYTTALAVRAILPYLHRYSQAAAAITAAGHFLLSQRNGSGLWGSDFESAQALLALAPAMADRSLITSSVDSLLGRQRSDGSWSGDVYITALVLQLLTVLDDPVAHPGFGALRGRILDGGTGHALAGVLISIQGPMLKQTLTDPDGRFEFTEMPPGQYELMIDHSGYSSVSGQTDLIAGKMTDLGELNLLPSVDAKATGMVIGTVVDADSGLPIAGANVNAGSKAALTGANGGYQLNATEPGMVTVRVDAAGYVGAAVQIRLNAGDVYLFSPRLSGGLVNTENSNLSGTIRDADTGLALSDVAIEIDGLRAAVTDSGGAYYIEPLTEGFVQVSASLAGYDAVSANLKIAVGNRYEFSPILYRSGLTPPGANAATVKGIVMDASTHLPLGGVSIKAHHDHMIDSLSTGDRGEFVIGGIIDAELILEFGVPGYQSTVLTISVQPLTVVDIGQIRLKPDLLTALLPDLTVTSIDRKNLNAVPDSLQLDGWLRVTVKNQGTVKSAGDFHLLAYYDRDRNTVYDPSVDSALGEAALSKSLPVNASETVDIPINGTIPFLDAPIGIWVDSLRTVTESNENNNQLSTVAECRGQPLAMGTLDPVLKWHWSGSSHEPSYKQVMSTPVVAQLNDDNQDGLINQADSPDIVFEAFSGSNYTGRGLLRALSGADGQEIWTIPATPRWVSAFYGPAVGDIDHDGLVEIVISGPNQTSLMVFENNGELKWSRSAGGAQPALADLNHDGEVEIIHGRTVFDSNGNVLWKASEGLNDPIPLIADLDGDGYLDVFAGGVAYNHDGTVKWNSGIGHFGSAVGNFDDDSYPEIVVKAVNSTIYLLEHTGAVKWGPVAVPGGGGGPITVADFDGDGQPEIGTAGASYYVVFETDGSIKWLSPTQDFSSRATGSSVFDFEGDGRAEVLYGDERYFRIFDGASGQVLFETPNPSDTLFEYPVIADVDNDGHAEIVVVSNNYVRGGPAGIRVFESRDDNWMPTRSIWNQHAYHIDNINGDGTVPQYESSSWLTHNTFRLNTFAGRNVLDRTDLTAGRLTLTDSGFKQKPSLGVRIGNAGLANLDRNVVVAFYQGKPEENGSLLGDVVLDGLAAGDYRDVTLDSVTLTNDDDLYAVVDAENQVSECDENNNRVSAPIRSASALGRIRVFPDAGEYGPNTDVRLSAIVQNTGELPASYRAALRIEDSEGATVAELPSTDIAHLSGGASVSLQQDWKTGLVLGGAYQLHGLLYDTAGNLLHEHNQPFAIVNDRIPALDASVVSDKPVYSIFDRVHLTVRLINAGQNAILPATAVQIVIYSSNGEIIFNEEAKVSELTPGAQRELTFAHDLRDAASGLYPVELRIIDGAGQQPLAVRSTEFRVERQSVQALSGAVTASPLRQYQGSPVLCTETASYGSDTAAGPIQLTSRLIKVESGRILSETTRTVVLGKGQSSTNARSIPTGRLAPDVYACILTGEIDGVSRQLAAAAFEILSPPVRIDASLDKGVRGRVLVLMDPLPEQCAGNSRLDLESDLTESPTDRPNCVQRQVLK
ncbi:MAG: carboxypeptidase regulatory-like domain-containing protein, partial [Gammaproteobacteria bacterium]